MAVKLRLMRMGKKKQPTYRIVAADARSPRNGRFIEILGTYDPRQEPSVVKIDTAKANDWIPDIVARAKSLKVNAGAAPWPRRSSGTKAAVRPASWSEVQSGSFQEMSRALLMVWGSHRSSKMRVVISTMRCC